MFERYTDSAKRAIYFARGEAVHRGIALITPDHLLLGLTWDADTRADRIAGLKGKAVLLRAAAGIPHLPITSISYKDKRDVPLSTESKGVLAYAAMEADEERLFSLDTDHLPRGLLRERTATSLAIEGLGISLPELRMYAARDRTEIPSQRPPWYWKPPFLKSPTEWCVTGLILVLAILLAGGIVFSRLRG